MSGATLVAIREQGAFTRLETERLDGLSPADLMRRLTELGERDPGLPIEEIRSSAFRSLDHAAEMAKQVESQKHPNTREDLRRTSVMMSECASHAIGELGFLEDAMEKNNLKRAVYHALRAGHFAATTEYLYQEPNAALGKRQRPKPTKAGRAHQGTGDTKEKRYRRICEAMAEVADDPEFPRKSLQVLEVKRRCSCSEATVYRALRFKAAYKKDP